MSEKQYQKLKESRQEGGQKELGEDQDNDTYQAGFSTPSDQYDQAVAIDPGATSGMAFTDGDYIVTETATFWELVDDLMDKSGVLGTIPASEVAILLEAPYKSAVGKAGHNETAIAYSSGQVAREAELLKERLSERYDVFEHDPAGQSASWSSTACERVIGDTWKGPDNEHVRDALRLLVFYNFL